MDKNTNIFLSQINFCRFLYYLGKNRSLLVKKLDQDKLICLIYQHIIKVTEFLMTTKTVNSLKLYEYESYKATTSFTKIYNTVCEYNARYRREYSDFRAKMPWQYLELIDSELSCLFDC